MANVKFFKEIAASPESELLVRGYSRRTATAEPRLSELVAEYRRIGYDVEVIEYRVEPDGCCVCFGAGAKSGEVYGDIYVRRKGQQNPTDESSGRDE